VDSSEDSDTSTSTLEARNLLPIFERAAALAPLSRSALRQLRTRARRESRASGARRPLPRVVHDLSEPEPPHVIDLTGPPHRHVIDLTAPEAEVIASPSTFRVELRSPMTSMLLWSASTLPLAGCSYTICGRETGEETERRHGHGYVYHPNKLSFKTVNSVIFSAFGIQPHVEAAKGDSLSNQAYCSKDGQLFECGKVPRQRNRSDLGAIGLRLMAGDSLLSIATNAPSDYIRYHGGIKV
jgi:hypothetical protein